MLLTSGYQFWQAEQQKISTSSWPVDSSYFVGFSVSANNLNDNANSNTDTVAMLSNEEASITKLVNKTL